MENSITIRIKEKSKFNRFMALLKDLDYIEVQKGNRKKKVNPPKRTLEKLDLFSLAGLWRNRNVTAREIRKQAWPIR